MARIVKAMLKEDFTSFHNCPEYVTQIREDYKGIIELDLDENEWSHIHCKYCDDCLGIVLGVGIVKDNNFLSPINLFDILGGEGEPN